MKKAKAVILLLILCGCSMAGDLVVAANSNFPVSSLSKKMIKKIYLDKIRFLKGKKIYPINMSGKSPLRARFEKNILNMPRTELERYWLKSHYMGHRPPKVLKSKEAVALFLQKVDNSLGYLDKTTAEEFGLKILYESDR